jgi:hypothetical protein
MLEPQDILKLKALLGEIKLISHLHLESIPGGVNVFAASQEAATLFRESMDVGALGVYGWGTKLRLH